MSKKQKCAFCNGLCFENVNSLNDIFFISNVRVENKKVTKEGFSPKELQLIRINEISKSALSHKKSKSLNFSKIKIHVIKSGAEN